MTRLSASYYTAPYLQGKYPAKFSSHNTLINSSVLPTEKLYQYIKNELPQNTLLVKGEIPVALKTDSKNATDFLSGTKAARTSLETTIDFIQIQFPWDIFKENGKAILSDFDLLTKNRVSQNLSDSNRVIGDVGKVFLEEGARVECSILNTTNGPIYIGTNATVMEGSMIRGGFALCEGSFTKMGTKVYGPTTIGPFSKVGGELNNVVILGYSNKGHDGFLGNSVIGEWCNLGADTNNSNLKNNYSEVKQWNYDSKSFISTGLQFCGLIMGDHSKSGINTMFNTGTVVGVSSNIFGGDFPRNFIPSFSWGSQKGYTTYHLEKSLETAERVMSRRNKDLTIEDKSILKHIFEESSQYRNY